jgi:hypothetical protein
MTQNRTSRLLVQSSPEKTEKKEKNCKPTHEIKFESAKIARSISFSLVLFYQFPEPRVQ